MCLQKLLRKHRETCLPTLEGNTQELIAYDKELKLAKALRILLIGFLFVRQAESRRNQVFTRIQDRLSEKLAEVAKVVDMVKQNGTYLIFSKKSSYLLAIDKVEADLALCERSNVLNTQFLEKIRLKRLH